MGCTASLVLLEGLRTILERNCNYSKAAVEIKALEEEEETLSFRESHLWIPTTALVRPDKNYRLTTDLTSSGQDIQFQPCAWKQKHNLRWLFLKKRMRNLLLYYC